MSSAGASSPGLSGLEGYASDSVPRQTSSDRAKVSTDTHSLTVPCICTAGQEGGEAPSAPARRREQRGRPSPPRPRPPRAPRPASVPTQAPLQHSRRRLQRLSAQRGASARRSGLPSAGLGASPGCFKASPGGRRGLRRSRLACSGSPLPAPLRLALPREGHRGRAGPGGAGRDRGVGHCRCPPAQSAHHPGKCRPRGPSPGSARGPACPGSGRGSAGARRCGHAVLPGARGRQGKGGELTPLLPHRRGTKLEPRSRSAAEHKGKTTGRFGATTNTKSVPQARAYLLNG